MSDLSGLAKRFSKALAAAQNAHYNVADSSGAPDTFHVIGAGGTISSIYEQLRNAAEYTDDHLLMQRAIRRFYKRIFLTQSSKDVKSSGEELITELTLAGYLPNDCVPTKTVERLGKRAHAYHKAQKKIRVRSARTLQEWTVDVLAVEAESYLRSHAVREAFEQFVFDHFVHAIDPSRLYPGGESREHELLLYIAIHRAILHSDDATIRWSLLRRFGQDPAAHGSWRQTNEMIDGLLKNKYAERLNRYVSRESAPFRVLWSIVDESPASIENVEDPHKFLSVYETQVNTEYDEAEKRINRGIIRSIIFLIITKVLIGVAIEVPYDLAVYGEILWVVLAINLLAPPLYMLFLRSTLSTPGPSNTRALVDRMERIMYGEPARIQPRLRRFSSGFHVAYALLFVLVFGLVTWGLVALGFTLVHLIIFFVFFSTASFLGFRLSRVIRELETVDNAQDGLSVLRDFLYLPFVVVGRKLSEGYARFNVVAIILDMLIELPLKTVLQVTRRWSAFISSKKDEL